MPELTIDAFRPYVGETFRVIVDGQWEMQARLAAVRRWGDSSAGGGREPFSLVFYGPVESQLPQRIYRVESDVMDPMEIFLVPIGPDPQGMRYESVFT